MVQNAYQQARNKVLAEHLITGLKQRNFDAYYAETKKDALTKALEFIPKETLTAWGGSMSIIEIGLIDYLLKNNYSVLNRNNAKTVEEKNEIYRKSLLCDTYLMGVNAISSEGELVNIDCIGNRVSALIYGPKSVVVIAGINKIAPTLDDAIKRARNNAATTNIQRVAGTASRKTPCFTSGVCHNCTSKDSLCSNIVITRMCNPAKRIKVIITGDNLGF